MHEQRRKRADPNDCARGLARHFTTRAWDLVEHRTLTPPERAEVLDAARAARALTRLADGSPDGAAMLRAHQLVAIAAWKVDDPIAAFEAVRLARGCEWARSRELTATDDAMTLAAEYLASLTRPGFTDPEPLMKSIPALPAEVRERLGRILHWPRERFAAGEATEQHALA